MDKETAARLQKEMLEPVKTIDNDIAFFRALSRRHREDREIFVNAHEIIERLLIEKEGWTCRANRYKSIGEKLSQSLGQEESGNILSSQQVSRS